MAATPATTLPTAPKSTLASERFMARLIVMVRIVPDAPTRAPPMMSTLLPMTKPVAAAANPVNEFSNEIMTGMSAPPTGSTSKTPRSSAPMAKPPRTGPPAPAARI